MTDIHATTGDTALTAALYYLDHDCFVVPCCPLDYNNRCLVHPHTIEKDIGKRPICGEQWQDLRLTREDVIRWWTQYPTANVGVLLAPSSLIVLDIDSLEAELEASAKGLPPGPQVKTGRGVQHYYRNPRQLQGRAIQVGESHAIDVLSNGIVIGAGSQHRTGVPYCWRVSFEEWELEDAPLWAASLLHEEEAAPLQVDPLPDDLPDPDLIALGIEPWIIQVIREGQPHPPFTSYASRSHALYAVICGLIQSGFDTPTIAGIVLNPAYVISAKPREQGAQWLARDIARARGKLAHISLNGHEQPKPIQEEEWSDVEDAPFVEPSPLSDTEENARTTAEEREPEEPTSPPIQPDIYTCPDILWQGIFAEIADRLQKRSFEVWMGILCAMGAIAHKNLHWHYHRPLYGMVYGLLISPTGQGKGFCTDICAALLPSDYTQRDSVQSGPALAPILAKIEKDQKGKVLYNTPRPAILIIEEWTALVKMSKIEFSNLQDVLNVLFHRTRAWNISRSDTQKSGGDVVVNNPTLSICATTTASLMQEYVSESMIRSGFLNRYLVLPGTSHIWDFYDEEGAGIDAGQIRGYLDGFLSYAWGGGKNVWHAYNDDAKARLVEWGRQTFNPLMQTSTLEAEGLKRLHTYSHIISLLYAWSTRSPTVLLPHVEAAIAVITTSKRFVEYLLHAGNQDIPKHKQYEMNIEGRILAKIDREPGINGRKVAMDLRKSGSFQDITSTTKRLIEGGMLRQQKIGRSYVLYRTT